MPYLTLSVGGGAADVLAAGDSSGNLLVSLAGAAELVTSGTITLNGATPVTVSVTLPSTLSNGGVYLIGVRNPSTAQTLTTKVYNVTKYPGQSSASYNYLTEFVNGTAGSDTGCRHVPVQGWCVGSSAALKLALSGAGTAVAAYQIFRI